MMESLANLVLNFVKVPLMNWYNGLSNNAKYIVNNVITIAVVGVLFYVISTHVISERLEDFDEQKSENHENGTIQRVKAQTSVYSNLQLLMSEVNCKRACIIELHNGVNNPSGLPYLYGEMTYEQTADGVPFIADRYQKITVSTYKMGIYMHNNFEYFGRVEKLKNIDKKFYNQVSEQGSQYVGIVSLHNKNKMEIGFLVVTFDKENMTEDEQKSIIFIMSKYATYIVSDLTMNITQTEK